MPVINRVAEWQDELAGWRRSLHERPELGFEEVETSRFVAERLRAFGVDEVHTGIARTGVVGVVRGRVRAARSGCAPTWMRCPSRRRPAGPGPRASRGKMHACGHDGHTTMLLGAARYLAETRNFDGTVYLIFQPAEEGGGGGRVMLNEGLFERFPADQVYGLHNWPWLPPGSFAMRAGPAMAAADHFEIELIGQGCHAAMPHIGRDPIVTAAAVCRCSRASPAARSTRDQP